MIYILVGVESNDAKKADIEVGTEAKSFEILMFRETHRGNEPITFGLYNK